MTGKLQSTRLDTKSSDVKDAGQRDMILICIFDMQVNGLLRNLTVKINRFVLNK